MRNGLTGPGYAGTAGDPGKHAGTARDPGHDDRPRAGHGWSRWRLRVAGRRGYNYGDLLRSGARFLEPVLLLVRDSRTRDRVEAEVRKRYGADYQVITTESVKEALGALGQLHDDQRQVALVLADRWLPEATGTELLAQARQFHPAARRVLLITWADQASAEPILRATVLGDIDAYVVKPGTPPDERFHRFVTEQLDEWGRSNLPGLEVVRVIGEEWSRGPTSSGNCSAATASRSASTLPIAQMGSA